MRRLFLLAFWTALLFACVMALLPRAPQLPGNPSDKVQHILAFATLAALALAAYPRVNPLLLGLGLAIVGAFIEFAQLLPALGRDGNWLDWLADCAAIAVVLLAGGLIRARLRRASLS